MEPTAKARIASIIRELPEDSSYDELLRELAFYRLIERGLVDEATSQIVDTTELKRQVRTWRP